MKKYKKLHPDNPLLHITPHVFRHTFCTNMANAGMDIKPLQYVMGHSDVGMREKEGSYDAYLTPVGITDYSCMKDGKLPVYFK